MLEKDAAEYLATTLLSAHGSVQANMPENVAAVPDHFTVHDLQKFQPHRRRFTGHLQTNDITDFTDYVKGNAWNEEKPSGFIDGNKLSCTAYFNLGDDSTPGHGDWRATLQLEQTSAYVAVRSINGRKHDQQDLATWLEDWADQLAPFARGEGQPYGNLARAVSAVRHIKISTKAESESKVSDFGAKRSAMEEVEARSELELPAGFIFTCQPYHGLPARSFLLRLQVITAKDDPQLVLRIVRLEQHEEEIVRDFKELLQEHLADTAKLTIGTFSI